MLQPLRAAAALALLLLLPASAAVAQVALTDENPVRIVSLRLPEEIRAGETATARLTVEVAEGWHIYGVEKVHEFVYQTVPALVLPEGLTATGAVRAPAPVLHKDETIGVDVPWHKGTIVFEIDFRANDDAATADVEVGATLDYMACTDEYCLDPATLTAEPVGMRVLAYPVRFGALELPAEVEQGTTATARLTVEIEDGWHIYGLEEVSKYVYRTVPKLVLPEGLTAGAVRAPPPELHKDETIGVDVPWHKGTVVFEMDFAVAENSPLGPAEVGAALDHMACTDEYCLDNKTIAAKPGTVQIREAPKGLGALVWAAFLGGLGSILMPCVYPLIPLTIAFFMKREGAKRGRRSTEIGRGLLFCLGIISTFTLIGLLINEQLQALALNAWFNLALTLLMVVLALSLLGWFDIQLPSSLTTRLQIIGSGPSFAAPVIMGIAFSFASFSCLVGVVGPFLVTGAELGRAFPVMLAYSIGFALPFFGLTLFPGAVAHLPKSGGWMNTIKVLLGFAEVCFAGYYLWRTDLGFGWGIATWSVVVALWAVTLFLAGLYLIGKVRLPKDDPVTVVSVPRAAGAIVVFTFALYLVTGLLGRVVFPGWLNGLLPPNFETAAFAVAGGGGGGGDGPRGENDGDGATTGTKYAAALPKPDFADETFHAGYGGIWWTTDLDRAKAIAAATGRKLFLNFTGIFCTNCREVESGMMHKPEVQPLLAEMVCVELWTDITSKGAEKLAFAETHTTLELSRRYQKLRSDPPPAGFGTAANPWYVIVSPEGRVLKQMGYPTGGLEEFAAFLANGH